VLLQRTEATLQANNSVWTRNFQAKISWNKKILGIFPKLIPRTPSPVKQNIQGVNLENILGIFPRNFKLLRKDSDPSYLRVGKAIHI
jgi:hypothetical protein